MLIQVDVVETDMYILIHLYTTAYLPWNPTMLLLCISSDALRYALPVKLSLRFVAIFPVRLPNLAIESSAISAVWSAHILNDAILVISSDWTI
jgi:hypothetical protein